MWLRVVCAVFALAVSMCVAFAMGLQLSSSVTLSSSPADNKLSLTETTDAGSNLTNSHALVLSSGKESPAAPIVPRGVLVCVEGNIASGKHKMSFGV